MNRTLALMLATLVTGTPLAATADSMSGMAMPGKLAVTAAFDPAPPKQGIETIKIVVKDTLGKSVKGAPNECGGVTTI